MEVLGVDKLVELGRVTIEVIVGSDFRFWLLIIINKINSH